jgi:hypothetical protein
MAVQDPASKRNKPIEFVSSISPNKRPDPSTEAGREQYQKLVDTLGSIFVESVARNRGVTTEDVEQRYGAGGLLIGREAVASGLADRTGSFEATLADLATHTSARRRAAQPSTAAFEAAPEQAITAAIAIPQTIRRRAMPSLRDTFMSLFDRAVADGSLVDAAADRETQIVSQNLDPEPITTTASGATVTGTLVTTPPTATAVANPSEEALRRELASARAENSRLRLERIHESARAFADGQFRDLKVLPPEIPLLVALSIQAQSDDESYGPVRMGDGTSSTRQGLLEAAYAARQSRKDLVTELHEPGMLAILAAADTRRTKQSDEPSPERIAELLAMTSVGQQVLADSVFASRTNGHKN